MSLGHPCSHPRGSYWSGVRGALQPLFHATGLASYHRITATAVTELEEDLTAAAKKGLPVDMAAAMCNLALKVSAGLLTLWRPNRARQ